MPTLKDLNVRTEPAQPVSFFNQRVENEPALFNQRIEREPAATIVEP